jgi:hypothetical protein
LIVGNLGTKPAAAEAPSHVEVSASAAATTTATTTQEVQTEKKVVKKVGYVDVQKAVRNYFSDIPVLAEIARCESTYRHFSTNGEVLRGSSNSKDVGVMQINERYHSSRARSLGIDLYSLEGNMKYARLLYKEQGSQPWKASASCWGRKVAVSSQTSATTE